MTVREPRRIHCARQVTRTASGGPVVQTLLVLAVGLAVFGVIAVARKLHASRVPEYLSPQVLTRINADYSELPQ